MCRVGLAVSPEGWKDLSMKRFFVLGAAIALLAGCQTYQQQGGRRPPPQQLDRSQVRMFDWRSEMVPDRLTGQQVASPNVVTVYYFSPPGNPRPKTQRLTIGQEFVGLRLEQVVPPRGSIPPWLVFRDTRTGGERLLRQMVTKRQ